MLDHTTHLRVKQHNPTFQKTPIHHFVLDKCTTGVCKSIPELVASSGLPEKQIRNAVYDMWRAGELSRKQFGKGTGRVWRYIRTSWNKEFQRWQPSDAHRWVWQEVRAHAQGYKSICQLIDIDSDVCKRVLAELFRAGKLKRTRVGKGKHWFYVYQTCEGLTNERA